MSVPGAPADRAFSTVDTVQYGDLDANRHLSDVVFLQLVEARIADVRSLAPDHDPTDPAVPLPTHLVAALRAGGATHDDETPITPTPGA